VVCSLLFRFVSPGVVASFFDGKNVALVVASFSITLLTMMKKRRLFLLHAGRVRRKIRMAFQQPHLLNLLRFAVLSILGRRLGQEFLSFPLRVVVKNLKLLLDYY